LKSFLMRSAIIKYFVAFLLFFHFGCQTPSVKLANSVDPDIILVNIGNGDREFLSEVLLKLDSLHPVVIGIDVFFRGRKTATGDTALAHALETIKNDVLCTNIDEHGRLEQSELFLASLAMGEGFLGHEETNGLVQNTTQLRRAGNNVYESFAVQLVKHWHPGVKLIADIDEQIPIKYERPLEMFTRVDGSFLIETSIDSFDFKDKVVLVGYIGPDKEDMYRTPLRFAGKEYKQQEPDSYGLVIIANEVRTILDYGRDK
jgi:CHASE2 domain-containing sensor protein